MPSIVVALLSSATVICNFLARVSVTVMEMTVVVVAMVISLCTSDSFFVFLNNVFKRFQK